MKKLFGFLFMAVMAVGLFSLYSCSDDWEEAVLSVDASSFSTANTGGTETVSIETNSKWKAVTSASWISFDKTEGSGNDELQIIIGRNSSNKRTGKVTICAGTEYAQIEITQAASTSGTLSVTTGDCTITRSKSGTKYKYTIKAEYTVKGGHLASETGVMLGSSKSKNTGTISDGTHTATFTVTSSSSSYTASYKAYAVNKNTGNTVYGTTKTKKYGN